MRGPPLAEALLQDVVPRRRERRIGGIISFRSSAATLGLAVIGLILLRTRGHSKDAEEPVTTLALRPVEVKPARIRQFTPQVRASQTLQALPASPYMYQMLPLARAWLSMPPALRPRTPAVNAGGVAEEAVDEKKLLAWHLNQYQDPPNMTRVQRLVKPALDYLWRKIDNPLVLESLAYRQKPVVAQNTARILTFSPRKVEPLGMRGEWATGLITSVVPDEQAERLGVKVGWRIVQIDGQPYSEYLLDTKVFGADSYVVTFLQVENKTAVPAIFAAELVAEIENSFKANMALGDEAANTSGALTVSGASPEGQPYPNDLLTLLPPAEPQDPVVAKASRAFLQQVRGDEFTMRQRDYGTCTAPSPPVPRWETWSVTADRVCCFNRKYFEWHGLWKKSSFFETEIPGMGTDFFDTMTGKSVFQVSPEGYRDFLVESAKNGFLTFRDKNFNVDNVRVLPTGEVVGVDGTHLGQNIPDSNGNRYLINMVCVAGYEGYGNQWAWGGDEPGAGDGDNIDTFFLGPPQREWGWIKPIVTKKIKPGKFGFGPDLGQSIRRMLLR